jgi:class 3 adenylate cyclase
MFCDLIGSTALSARVDAEDLQEVIRGYQACVATTIQQAALHRQPEGWHVMTMPGRACYTGNADGEVSHGIRNMR